MNTVIIKSNEEAKEEFQKIADLKQDAAFIKESESMDGANILELIIENLPDILNSVVALIAVLKSKNIAFTILKDGIEVKSLDEEE